MYKNQFIYRSLWIYLLALLCTTLTANAQLLESDHTPELGYDIDISLTMEKVPALYKSVPVSVTVSSSQLEFKNLKIEVITQEGIFQNKALSLKQIELLSPQLSHQNDFNFKALDSGKHKITVKVSGYTVDGNYKDRYAYLKFTVNSDPNKNHMGWGGSTQTEDEDSRVEAKSQPLSVDSEGMVTIHQADENLNEVIRKIPASEYFSESSTEGSSVTISGRYTMRNRENTATIGFSRNLVRLVNSSTGDHLAWAYTDNNGNFTFGPVTNPGADGMRVRVYSVIYIAGDIGYGVCEYPDCPDNAAADSSSYDHFYYRQTQEFTTPDGNQDIGTYTSGYSLTNNLRAHWIKQDMYNANTHLIANTTIRGPFTAEWADDNDTHGNHYHRDANIHFKADVGDGTNHTVLHELGHNVMWNAGTFPAGSDCPSPHYINRVSGPQCAWTEGWASIFLALVNNSPLKCFPPSTTNCTDFETDPSYDVCGASWDCNADSDEVEGHVIGAVWDMYDTADDDFDIESYNRDAIYNILETDTNNSFVSWWTSWINDGNSNLALNSLFQNDIEYGDRYDVRVNNPTVNDSTPVTFQNNTAFVTVRNLGDVSSINTKINFYISTNSIISTGDQLLAVDYSGVLDRNINRIVSEPFQVVSEGRYWVGACFDDTYGFDANSGNNCSNGVEINVTPYDLIYKDGFED